jgi:ribose-phosphate pyrophosphokinase
MNYLRATFKIMPARINETKLFSGQNSRYLAEKIAKSYGKELGSVTINRFKDGEFAVSFDETVRGCDVFLIQSTFAPQDNLMELLMMVDAAKRASAHYITAVIPYFGMARQDRKDKPRVAIGARLVADLLSAAGVYRVMTMDLHAAQIQGFFNVPVDHLYASKIFIPYIQSLNLDKLTICAPDMGAASRVRSYLKKLDADMVVCDKVRKEANKVESITLIGDVKDRDVVIIDDIIDTAGTICKVADAIMERGARSVRACCTHPVLSGEAYSNINNSALVEVVVADTLPLREGEDHSKIRVISVADLFAKAIRSVNEHQSINNLFEINI